MRVGVYLGDITPVFGGGFTFQDEIFQALLRVESKHAFVIFAHLKDRQLKEALTNNVQFVSLERNDWERQLSTFNRIKARAMDKVPIMRDWFGSPYQIWLKKTLANHSIEFMWFVVPEYNEVDIPFVFTVWDLQHRLQPWFPEVSADGRWLSRERLYSTAIQRASAVIVGAEAGKDEIVHSYRIPPERVRLIPHPTPRFALTASQTDGKEVLGKYNIPEGYLFYPSQFWPHKNHVGLLMATKLLKEKYDLFLPVVFVGSDMGNLHHVRKMVEELGLSSQVHFLGFVSREDLVGLYRNALALVYLTFFGPENLPPLEAFGLGCPVIASKVSGAEEQLGDAALLVDPKDEEQIAVAIKTLIDDDSLRDSLVSRGMARARKWTAEDFVQSVLSIIDEFEPFRRCWD